MLENAQATGRRIRVGVVGAGLIAQIAHLPNVKRLSDRMQLVAIADPSARRRDALAAKYGVHAYEQWLTMIERGGLDALIVCSPNCTHGEVTLAGLTAGLHVLVEKPLCIDPADGNLILAAQARADKVLQVGYMKRFDPAFDLLRSGLDGRGGELRYVDVVTRDPWLPRSPFIRPDELVPGDDVPAAIIRRTDERERDQVEAAVGSRSTSAVKSYGYTFLACLIHDINLVHGLLDELGEETPARPIAAAEWAEGRAGSVVQELSNRARWVTTWLLLEGTDDFEERIELYFEDAVERLVFPAPYLRPGSTRYERITGAEGFRHELTTSTAADAYLNELEHFYDCIAADAECRAPATQGVLDIEVLSRLFRDRVQLAAGAETSAMS